ncbi:MAG: hypothetical protein ACI936_001364 [Paraglaciecola sp.]|jgi:hypothetical protein
MNNLKFILTIFIISLITIQTNAFAVGVSDYQLMKISASSGGDKSLFALKMPPKHYDILIAPKKHLPYIMLLNDLASNAWVKVAATFSKNKNYVKITSSWSLPLEQQLTTNFNFQRTYAKKEQYNVFTSNSGVGHYSTSVDLGGFLRKNSISNFANTNDIYALFLCFKVGNKVTRRPLSLRNGYFEIINSKQVTYINTPSFLEKELLLDYWFEVGVSTEDLLSRSQDQYSF